MNINIDNYEAYLIDYLDGQLCEEESRQLKQFVAQQGLDFDELVQDLPTLEPTPIEFEHKKDLKKKATIIPLIAKIAAAAAVVALLFGLFWNRNETSPQEQPMAEQKTDEILNEIPEQVRNDESRLPEFVSEPITNNSSPIIHHPSPGPSGAETPINSSPITKTKPKEVEANHDIVPLLANIEPRSIHEVQFSDDYLVENGLLPQMPICPVYFEEYLVDNENDEFESKPSLFEQGFLWLSNGRCDNLGGLIHLGLHRASHDVIHYTTKAALTAYYTIDIRIEESREKDKEEVEE